MPVAPLWPLPPMEAPVILRAPSGAPMPLAPVLDENAFLEGLLALLPQGRAWPRDPDSILVQMFRGWAHGQALVHQRQVELLAETNPATTDKMLPEWEASLGLPDPCIGPLATVQQRKRQVLARWVAQGGQTLDYLIGFAADLGIAMTPTECRAWTCGETSCDQPLHGWQPAKPGSEFTCGISACNEPLASWANGTPEIDWDFVIKLTATTESVAVFTCGISPCDEPLTTSSGDAIADEVDFECGISPCDTPLRAWHNAVFECEFRRILGAHLLPIFAYTSGPSLRLSTFILDASLLGGQDVLA